MSKKIKISSDKSSLKIQSEPKLEEAKLIYTKEYWTGDSRDGAHVNGDGYHYYKMSENDSIILEAYEYYERDDGVEVVSPLPEMLKISWRKDLGFENWDALDIIELKEFQRIKSLIQKP